MSRRQIDAVIGDGIVGLDTEGRISFINPAGPALLGYSEGDLLGQPLHPLVHHTWPDGRPFPRSECAMFMTSVDGRPRTVDTEVLWRKDGTAVPVEYSTYRTDRHRLLDRGAPPLRQPQIRRDVRGP